MIFHPRKPFSIHFFTSHAVSPHGIHQKWKWTILIARRDATMVYYGNVGYQFDAVVYFSFLTFSSRVEIFAHSSLDTVRWSDDPEQ